MVAPVAYHIMAMVVALPGLHELTDDPDVPQVRDAILQGTPWHPGCVGKGEQVVARRRDQMGNAQFAAVGLALPSSRRRPIFPVEFAGFQHLQPLTILGNSPSQRERARRFSYTAPFFRARGHSPMQHTTHHLRAAATLLALVTAPFLAADTVYLQGGDRISGTITSKIGDVLTLATPYAGDVKIDWTKVESVETDTPARFILKDHTAMNALATRAADGAVILKSGELITTAPLALADVEFINPPPEISGEGVSVSGHANIGLTSNRGNTDNDQLYYDAETVIRSVKNRFTIGAVGNNRKEDGKYTARGNRAYFKYDHFIGEKWYAYANTDVEKDEFKDLNLRTTIGAGAGYQFWETPDRNLALEGGVTYVNEDYDIGDDDNFAAARWAIRYTQVLFGGDTRFFHTHEGLVSLDDTEDTLIRMQTGFRFPLVENLNATIQYNIDWQNNPAPGFKRTDRGYVISVGYLW